MSSRCLSFLFLFLLLGKLSFANTSQQLERVEPPFWWSDMKNKNLQLLVYGKNIAELKVRIDHKKVELKKVHKVDSPNYLFLDLELDKNIKATSIPILFTRGNTTIISHDYEIREREKNQADIKGFDSSDAIYLITPDRFANGDTDNDEVKGMLEGLNSRDEYGRHGGDLQGIRDHLDYIDDLGFTAIWLNPILENNEKEQSYHGYATTDYYKVDPRFGTNEEYKKLSEAASEKGIKLIMDMIANHCGSNHWWTKDPPTKDWFNFQGNYTNTNHRRETVQDPHAAEADRMLMEKGWFAPTMPDLNQANPFLATYLMQNSIWWIEYLGLAGIRQDTYSYPNKDFMSEWTCRIMEEYPNFNIVGEEWSENPAITSYWQKGKINPDDYTSCLPSVMDFPLNIGLTKALNEEENWGAGIIRLYISLANDFQYADPYNLVIFPDNHDMTRIYTQLNEDYDMFKMALTFILTTRGIPQIYYGTEIIMGNPGTTSHGIIRKNFPGGWEGDVINAFDNTGLTTRQIDAKKYLQKLLQWRKEQTTIHKGKLLHYEPRNGVYVYFRMTEKKAVMVILNKNKNITPLDMRRFHQGLRGQTRGYDVLSEKLIPITEELLMPARSSMIIEFEH